MQRIVVLILCLCVLAATVLTCVVASTNSNSGSPVHKSSRNFAPAKHFKVGQTAKIDDTWNIAVVSAKASEGSGVYKPKSGNFYLLVTIAMKNISSSEQNVSSLINFNLRDKDGQKYTQTVDPDAGNPPEGNVEANKPLEGVITYEVPSAMKSFTLSFQADGASSVQTIWDLSV